jgi:hypothetical protein
MEVPLSLQSHSVGALHYEVRLFFEKDLQRENIFVTSKGNLP